MTETATTATTRQARPPRFSLGEGPCLDFVNTWEDRGRPDTDRLDAYPALLAFARQSELLDDDGHDRLAAAALRDPSAAAAAFDAAVELRDILYRLFSALSAGRSAPPADLDSLNATLPEALAGLRIERSDGADEAYTWTRSDAAASLTAPLRPLVRSAAELLVSPDLPRLRECDGADCTWLFLDQSRNRSRRWCSMETCGNRAKARRHYRRHRDGAD